MLFFQWPPGAQVSISGNATAAKQDAQITLETAANTKLDTLHTDLTTVQTKQDAGNTSLASIDTKLNTCSTSANQVTANGYLSSVDGKLTATLNGLKVDGSAVTQPVSAASLPLPTGAATAVNQTTANTSLSSIDGKLGSLGQKAMAGSAPVVIASDQSAIPASQSGTWNITNISGTVSLPTGAATAANQATANTSLSSLDTKTPSLGQATMAASRPVVIASNQSALPTQAPTGRSKVLLYRNDYSSVNVTTSAYTQITASTSATINHIQIFDSSGSTMVLAVGAAASEVDQFYIFPGGVEVDFTIPSGSRISVKAVSANATSGEITINFLS